MARPPDGARTLAGYTLGPRLGSDIYGDVFAGVGEGAREVVVRVIAAPLAGDRSFADHLTRQAAPRLHSFSHRAVIGTLLVARDGRDLVVVTEPAREACSVADLLAAARGRGGGLPPRVMAAIARAVIDGLASAHAVGLVHGAVHPRSVLVDRDGSVRLTDLAVGFAAMSAAAAGSEAMPLRGLSGFVSPEVALGDAPTTAADVYGIGALMYAMMTGDQPAGPMAATPALERLVMRALETDLTRRFTSAVELEENFTEALEDDRSGVASAGELAELSAQATAMLARGDAAAAAVDAETEDLLASLDGVVEVSRPGGGSRPGVAVAGRKLRSTGSLDAVLFDLDDEPVPIPKPNPMPDPGPSQEPSPESEPTPSHDPSPNPIPSPEQVPVPPPSLAAATVVTPTATVVAPTVTVTARAATAVPEIEAPKRRSWAWVWLPLIGVGAAVLGFGLTRQKDELSAKEKAAKAHKAAMLEEQAAAQRRLTEARPDPGAVRVHSTPDNAGVWLLLGRAPFESISLQTDQAWELRVELEGYQAKDVRVGARDWRGDKDAHTAQLAVTLEPAAAKAMALPGVPPEPPADEARGVDGNGRLSVTSTPPGAAVWLLVGVTDTMELDGIEAGRDYDLKVTKDGFLPGFVRFAAEEWRSGGDPALPLAAAPKKSVLERSVELVAAPRAGKGR